MGTSPVEAQVERDVLQIVGGNFSPDALGPAYDQVIARLRAAPDAYLNAFERLFLSGRRLDARAQSRLYLPSLLRLLGDAAPARVRSLAERLLGHYDTAMSVADDAAERDHDLESLPPPTARLVQRLDSRRRELRDILGGARR